jgi:fatty-acyl-CoA synthase
MRHASRIPYHSSLWSYVDQWRQEQPDDVAIVFEERRWTWGELAAAIDALVESFRDCGVQRGDRIAMLSWQCVEFVIAYVAIERLGATFVGLSPRDQLPELSFLLQDARPRVVLVSASLGNVLRASSVVAELRENHPCVELIVSLHGAFEGAYAFDALLASRNNETLAPPEPMQRDSSQGGDKDEPPICVVYTSGSSGRPKAARLPNRSLLHNYRVGAELFHHKPFRTYNCHPIDHIGGIDRMYQTIMLGGMMVLDPRFDAELTLKRTQDESLTYWLGEATQYIKLAPFFDSFDLSSLRVVRYVGPLPEDILKKLRQIARLVMTSYGSSETCASLVFTDASTSVQELRDGNVGRPINGFTMRVVDDNRKRIVGEVGELEIQSEWIFGGYGAEANADKAPLTQDGWFRPGDLFKENEDGSFTIVGRSNDFYKSGGYNVHPAEIEAALMIHPLVKEVCVIGVPDPTFITVGRAFVVLRSVVDAEQLREFLRERMAGYKVPKEIVVLEQMPLLRNDKVDKSSLRNFES